MLLRRVESFVPLATNLCSQVSKENRHVSLIFRQNRLISVGTNDEKPHTETRRRGYYSEVPHSELAAFMKVPYTQRDTGLVLANYRVNRHGNLRMSKPCSRCLPWCLEVFKEIWYTNDAGIIQLK